MSSKDDNGSLSSEVSSRLDELFGDEDAAETPGSETLSKGSSGADDVVRVSETQLSAEFHDGADGADAESPIKDLKALVFSIDWEITDETMVDFLTEVRRLKNQYKDDKILYLFLKLHESVGRYIKAKKARAHPDSMKFITSVYKNFQKALLTPGITKSQKKRLLSSQVKKFKTFKKRILVLEKAVAPAEESAYEEIRIESIAEPVPERAAERPGIPLESQAALDYIVEEIRKTIKAEFQTLLQIIKNLGA